MFFAIYFMYKKILYTWKFFFVTISLSPTYPVIDHSKCKIFSAFILSYPSSKVFFPILKITAVTSHFVEVNIIQTPGRPSGNFNTAHGGGNGYTVRISFMCAVQIYRLSKSATKRWLKKAFSQQCRRSYRLLFSSWWFWYG